VATHQRHVIRQAVVALLAAAGTPAGSRVFDTPSEPRTTFPALSVEDRGESQRATTMPGGPARTIERELVLEVSVEVQQVGAFAQARDQLAADVEAALAGAQIAGVKSIEPAGYTPESIFGAERPIAVGRQLFRITYYTTQGAPGVAM
jgi:hypothetical protein